MDQVPKIIKPLVKEWAPKAYCISFKLETDPALLVSKAKLALDRYGHQLVIGNILSTRKHVIWLISKQEEKSLKLSTSDIESGIEIEKYIVEQVILLHSNFISGN
jgi:phosphopantothenate-cysteine ligase